MLPAIKLLPKVVERLDEVLFNSLAETVIDSLPEKDLDEFERVLSEGDEAKVRAFIQERAPEAEPLMRARVQEIRERADAILS